MNACSPKVIRKGDLPIDAFWWFSVVPVFRTVAHSCGHAVGTNLDNSSAGVLPSNDESTRVPDIVTGVTLRADALAVLVHPALQEEESYFSLGDDPAGTDARPVSA